MRSDDPLATDCIVASFAATYNNESKERVRVRRMICHARISAKTKAISIQIQTGTRNKLTLTVLFDVGIAGGGVIAMVVPSG